ncbi:MAG TPA: peptidylprolyl isomerase [Thermodesulfovibrionales bacterium]|nr:peptidylprolyl isomerase [Thermodesulfovibrionales bacterium]
MVLKIFATAVILSLFLVSASLAGDEDPVLGKAGGYTITKSDLDRLISYYPPDKQKHLRENPQQKITLVKRMLEVKMIADIARKEGFDKRPDVKEQLEFMVDDYLTREYLAKVVTKDVTVTDEDITQYYAVNKDKFPSPEQVRARHILIKVPSHATNEEKEKARQLATDILERINKGEDFAKLAEEFSQDSVSKAKGGDLGYFPKGKMLKAFEDVAFSLNPGQVSGIVQTKFGYHIIKVEDHKKAGTKHLDEVRDSIRTQLTNDAAKSKGDEFMTAAKKDSGLEVYPDRIMGQVSPK